MMRPSSIRAVLARLDSWTWPAILALSIAAVVIGHSRSTNQTQTQSQARATEWRIFNVVRQAEFEQLGKRLQDPGLRQVVGGPAPLLDQTGTKLILFISDVTCNINQDVITRHLNEIASDFGLNAAAAVVSASNMRFAVAFAQVNRARFAVYFDASRSFAQTNAIHGAPMLFISMGGVVKAAALVATSMPDLAAPLFALSRRTMAPAFTWQ